jgi:hypothetical protein
VQILKNEKNMRDETQKNKQQGATAVELGIILPLFVLLLFGIIEFSIIMYNQAMITNAAREGARLGIVWAPEINNVSYRVTREEIIAHTRSWLGNNLITFGNNSIARVTPEDPSQVCAGVGTNQTLTVRVEYDYNYLFLPGSITLSTEANMRCESVQDAST